MDYNIFKKTQLAAAVSMVVGAATISPVYAQDNAADNTLEEVIVTGIRGSLQASMDIKRDAQGVVDAISAEDIGKMPDTNLAESLQRISGVSIDRSNGEGRRVTVRGFGPDYNLVTLNNRQMPTLGSDRSFDFSDLAAESVSGVEVYKTFDSTKASGGIGSLINIKTARPLDKPGLAASVGVKGIMDTTNVKGDDITPEVSGVFSNTFADDTFGVLISGSYQGRDNQNVTADIDNWRNDIPADNATIQDNRSDPNGTIYSPRNFGYGFDNISRERINGQLVLQYSPIEDLTATLDYTYSHIDYTALNTGVGIWYNDGGSDVTSQIIDENGTVRKQTAVGDDFASNQRLNTSETENKSVGVNLEWTATDNLTVTLDAHNSTNENGGTGRGQNAYLILAAASIDQKTYDSTSGKDIPYMDVTFRSDGVGIENGYPTAASYDSLFGEANLGFNKSEVSQFQLGGVFDTMADSGITSVEFGVANTEISNRWVGYSTGQLPAGWYGGNQDIFPDEIFTAESFSDITPSFSGGGTNVPFYHSWDFETAVQALENGKWAEPEDWAWGSGPTNCDPCEMRIDTSNNPNSDHLITETTTAAYVEFNGEGTLADMPLSVSTGLRFEQTDIHSSSFQQSPTELVWISSTEWSLNKEEGSDYTNEKGSYGVFLPSFDVALNVTDDVITRLSYSKSIARPALSAMTGVFSVTDRPKPGERTGNAGNPDLKPYMSDNLDISAEWYYAEGSYVSVGAFVKQVDNFIVNKIVDREVGNLRDPEAGPRAAQAIADLQADGATVDATAILAQINENAGQPEGTPVIQNNDDPLAVFGISQPVNEEQATIQGLELAVQHMFGDTGFGVQANMTLTGSDLSVDNHATDFQFVLPGLSDSANFVAFYDNNGLQARIAYNWRDTFLNGVGQGNAPYYTEAYGQIDMNASYELPMIEGLTVFVEGINVTESSQRQYARFENQFKHAEQWGARYNIGARFTFQYLAQLIKTYKAAFLSGFLLCVVFYTHLI